MYHKYCFLFKVYKYRK